MYRTIDAKFWHDQKITKLSKDAKFFMLYLVTNPHSHLCGLYYLPSVMATHESGLKKSELDALWHTLSSSGLAYRDDENQVVWVVNMLGYQGRGAKNEAAAAKQLRLFTDSPLIARFVRRYPQFKDRVSIGYPAQDQFGTPEQEQEQEQDRPTVSLSTCVDDGGTKARFISMWNATKGVTKISGLSKKRLAALNARLREKVIGPDGGPLAWIDALELSLKKFPLKFTRGDPAGWVPDGDWILKPDSVTRILEGKYDWSKGNGRSSEPTPGLVHDPATAAGPVHGW